MQSPAHDPAVPSAASAATSAPKKVFLVEDHPVFRAGLRRMIEDQPDLEVCGEADSAAKALDGLRRLPADAAVVDISLEGTDGIELLKSVRAEHGGLPILVLSMHDEGVYATRAIRAGANGYLMKRTDPEAVMQALRSVMAGELAVSNEYRDHVVSKALRGDALEAGDALTTLSDRELEVFNLLGQGLGTRDIAAKLRLSPKTVESHRLNIKTKLGAEQSTEVVRRAVAWVAQNAR